MSTNRGRESVDLIFEHIGITDTFDAVVTIDESHDPKPGIGGVQLIAKELGVAVGNLIMVGDTSIDMETAGWAGMKASIGLTHGFPKTISSGRGLTTLFTH